ncbi:MAG: thermonuclease family protein [Actinomycetaceae bacterium]|nr:thermonuclease family protein [Actinomycetaceae bacterium]
MINRSVHLFFGTAVYILGANAALAQMPAEPVAAKVQRVVDGDTIHVHVQDGARITGLGRSNTVKVRILGIDAPESCQVWGKESTRALRQMLPLGTVVLLRPTGVDKYGRLLSDVYVGETKFNVAAAMVESGNAWNWEERFSKGRYAVEQKRAQASSSGLWQGGSAIRPSDFRKLHGSCK